MVDFADIAGLPYMGREPMAIKNDDPPELKPKALSSTKVRIFDLADEDQKKLCEKTLTEVQNLQLMQRALVAKMDYQYDPSQKSWRLLLVWVEYYLVSPEEAKDVVDKIQCVGSTAAQSDGR